MHISIWQQFSSNHSANFEIIGTFKTVDLAHKAAEALRQMFREIARERMAYEPYCHDCPPTVAEVGVAKQYGFDWGTKSIDWLVVDDDDIRNVVELDQFVFVTNLRGDNTWMGAEPIDQLIQNIGGDIIVTGEVYSDEVILDVSCKAPDEATAISLYEQIESYWQLKDDSDRDPLGNYVLPPWINFWKGGEIELSKIWTGSVEDLVRQYHADDTARKQYLAEHAVEAQRLTDELDQAYKAGDLARQKELLHERYPHINPPADTRALSLDQTLMALHAIFDTAVGGKIDRSGQELMLTDLPNYSVGDWLPALIGFLRANGCTDVQYKIDSTPTGGIFPPQSVLGKE